MPEAARTLVKSPPELWAEVSDPTTLARHLGAFGDIRIVRLEPEATVAWEGDRARGTVALEPTGWGTKVTVAADETAAAPPAPPRRGLFSRLLLRRAAEPPQPDPVDAPRVLDAMLGNLGAAHRRPFSTG